MKLHKVSVALRFGEVVAMLWSSCCRCCVITVGRRGGRGGGCQSNKSSTISAASTACSGVLWSLLPLLLLRAPLLSSFAYPPFGGQTVFFFAAFASAPSLLLPTGPKDPSGAGVSIIRRATHFLFACRPLSAQRTPKTARASLK